MGASVAPFFARMFSSMYGEDRSFKMIHPFWRHKMNALVHAAVLWGIFLQEGVWNVADKGDGPNGKEGTKYFG